MIMNHTLENQQSQESFQKVRKLNFDEMVEEMKDHISFQSFFAAQEEMPMTQDERRRLNLLESKVLLVQRENKLLKGLVQELLHGKVE